jgi:hypothetical protein
VTAHPQPRPTPRPLVTPFPEPGTLIRHAYRELHLAINGTAEQKKALGPPTLLPRPWDPASCRTPKLRNELWEWLEKVVTWLNQAYSWDADNLIPACWPLHPHLVHELAVVADQRRRAGLAMTSEALEEWHRYCLPAFTDRIRGRLKTHCDDGHQPWPGLHRHREHIDDERTKSRTDAFSADVNTLPTGRAESGRGRGSGRPRLGLVDLDTGEVQDDPD